MLRHGAVSLACAPCITVPAPKVYLIKNGPKQDSSNEQKLEYYKYYKQVWLRRQHPLPVSIRCYPGAPCVSPVRPLGWAPRGRPVPRLAPTFAVLSPEL